MELEIEPRKIREVVFSLENKPEVYRYDVCQSIKILDLKRMIETALQISHQRIKLFHNNNDYTQKDDSRLETLFPTLHSINFVLMISNKSEFDASLEKEISLKLRLNAYCENHLYKYPNHFCFDCLKSYCSICNVDNLHLGHETIEKYDYLLDSSVIVSRIFCKISEEIKDLKFENEENVHKFSAYLTQEFFDKLRNLITEIEIKIKNILNVYMDSSKNSLKQIELNLKTLKDNCAEALEHRKSELQLENMLVDENIIINYYNTILQIYAQKQPIELDKERFSELIGSLSVVKPVAENLFNEIRDYLMQKLSLDAFAQCEKEILKNKINPINSEKVKKNIREDILGSTGKIPNLFGNKDHSKRINNLVMKFGDYGYKDKSNLFTFGVNAKNKFEFISEQIKNVEKAVGKVTEVVEATEENPLKKYITPNSETKQKQPELTDYGEESEESIWNNLENETCVYTLQQGTKNIYIYSEQRHKVKKFIPNFPLLKPEKHFLPGCAWTNFNKKLFISGGLNFMNSFSNEFLVYENSERNQIIILKTLNEPRANHSMFTYDKHIFIVGGEASETTEIFDTSSNTLITKVNHNYVSVDNPILWVHNDFLYSFFGRKNQSFVSFVQRVNLKDLKFASEKSFKWERIPFKKINEINIELSNAGVIPCGANEIYFFGGLNENGISNESIIYNFETREFSNAHLPLEQGQFFQDSKFIELAKQSFGQFSLTEADNFLKINVSIA